MIKIWFMLVLISTPNSPSVKYNGFIYPNEEACEVAKYELMESYKDRSSEYKLITQVDSHCVEFESFPIKGLMNKTKELELGV
tara:strand:+ start:570 stop:818 length:249 start_codon:yes stop_codon:yes gene_type:complete